VKNWRKLVLFRIQSQLPIAEKKKKVPKAWTKTPHKHGMRGKYEEESLYLPMRALKTPLIYKVRTGWVYSVGNIGKGTLKPITSLEAAK